MIAVTAHAQGSVLPVRAKAGARENTVIDEYNGALRVAVSAAPEQGKANEAIVTVLAETLGCKKSQITLIAGETSKNKKFLIAGLSAEEVLSRIDAVLTPTLFEPLDPEL